MARTVDLHLLQGQTYRHTFVLQRPDPDSTEENPLPPLPLDTADCTARMQVRQKYGMPVLLELTTENGGLILDPDEPGRLTIYMTAEQTDALGTTEDPLKPRSRLMYDVELVFPSGDVLRIMESEASTIRRNITREDAQ